MIASSLQINYLPTLCHIRLGQPFAEDPSPVAVSHQDIAIRKMATAPADSISSSKLSRLSKAVSPSWTDWQKEPSSIRAEHPHIGAIMDMVGLEKVKAQVVRIKAKVDTCRKQGTDLRQERLGLVLLGNPRPGIPF